MNTIKLSEYGAVLTGRQFGADVMQALLKTLTFPVALDFSGVESLGSSFGDEIVPVIAGKQGNQIMVLNANSEVKATLKDIAFDSRIEIKAI